MRMIVLERMMFVGWLLLSAPIKAVIFKLLLIKNIIKISVPVYFLYFQD